MKILIAEDDNISKRLLNKIIEKEGHTTTIVSDGLEAWELIQKEDFHMIITDWMMPNMDGLALCRKVRAAELPNYIYIILLTSKGQKNDTVEGLQAGADEYITKPFNPEELCTRIRSGERITGLEDKHHQALNQLLQSEKMASIGQLAAGVAHEINNPTGFVSSNLKSLSDYHGDIGRVIKLYRNLIENIEKDSAIVSDKVIEIQQVEEEVDLDYILKDANDLIGDCREGMERIKKIVIALKDFAHPGEDIMVDTDINNGIESTLNIVSNELKYKASVVKEFGKLPLVSCYPQQLNQVFMNLFVNAAQAIENKGVITVVTKANMENVEIKISDTGSGIEKKRLLKIFDPFFTTKEIGKGTGLGLNVAYNIITKHNGSINVESTVGKGTTFTITLPINV